MYICTYIYMHYKLVFRMVVFRSQLPIKEADFLYLTYDVIRKTRLVRRSVELSKYGSELAVIMLHAVHSLVDQMI